VPEVARLLRMGATTVRTWLREEGLLPPPHARRLANVTDEELAERIEIVRRWKRELGAAEPANLPPELLKRILPDA
jgi:DNA-binding transcriptional MerR regulator